MPVQMPEAVMESVARNNTNRTGKLGFLVMGGMINLTHYFLMLDV